MAIALSEQFVDNELWIISNKLNELKDRIRKNRYQETQIKLSIVNLIDTVIDCNNNNNMFAAFAVSQAVNYTNWDLIKPIYQDICAIHPKPPTSPDIINLAKLIYKSQDYSLMPILGDALEEAGYMDASHCKEKQHYKGCSLIDLILGKE
jgi:hypothetical protein